MMLALLLLQATPPQRPAGPTVGDTIWLARTVAVPPGAAVRPQPWNPTDGPVEALGPARLVRRGDSAEVAYPAVAWRPGHHDVTIPGPLLLLEGGGVDSAPPYHAALDVASVLPAGAPDSALPVQPAATTVPRGDRTPVPLALFLTAAAALLAPVHWWWRRRGTPAVVEVGQRSVRPPLARWAEAGEGRAALAVAAAELRDAIARGAPAATPALETEECLAVLRRERPDWPQEEIERTLHALDAARFRPGAVPDASALVATTEALAKRIGART